MTAAASPLHAQPHRNLSHGGHPDGNRNPARLRHGRTFAAVVFVLAAAFVGTPRAETFTGRVVGITDGDTVTVLDDAHRLHKIRLAGIDAPETGQAWGRRSKEALSDQVFRQRVTVHWHKVDRYQRRVGLLMRDDHDVNRSMVHAGWAWHYTAYAAEQSPDDRAAYAAAESEARERRRGLWRDSDPVAPWDYRKLKRSPKAAAAGLPTAAPAEVEID